MRTTRFPSFGGKGTLPNPPWMKNPPEAYPPGCRPPGCKPPWRQTPLDAGHVTCDAWRETTPHPVNRMTHKCKNITLSQTSYAGGNRIYLKCSAYVHGWLFYVHTLILLSNVKKSLFKCFSFAGWRFTETNYIRKRPRSWYRSRNWNHLVCPK